MRHHHRIAEVGARLDRGEPRSFLGIVVEILEDRHRLGADRPPAPRGALALCGACEQRTPDRVGGLLGGGGLQRGVANEAHELLGTIAPGRRHREIERIAAASVRGVADLSGLAREHRVDRALDRGRPRVARRGEPQLDRDVLAGAAAVEDPPARAVDRVAAGRIGLDERIDEDRAAGFRERERLLASGAERAGPEIGRVEPAAFEARRARARDRDDPDIEGGVLRRAGGNDALDDDHRGVLGVEHRLGTEFARAVRVASDPAAGHLADHLRPDLGGHEPASGALESHDEAVAADDGGLVADHDRLARDGAAEDRLDVEFEVLVAAGRLRLGIGPLDHVAPGAEQDRREQREGAGGRRESGSSHQDDRS